MDKIDIIIAKHRLSEYVARRIAWALPKSIVTWAGFRILYATTSGKWNDTVVTDLPAMDAIARWTESCSNGADKDDTKK